MIAISPEVEQKISSGSSDGRGISCQFFIIDNHFGLKLYYDLPTALFNYLIQKLLSKSRFMPEAFDFVKIGNKFGFVTELCPTICKEQYLTISHLSKTNNRNYYEQMFYKKTGYISETLVKKYKNIISADLHWENIAIDKYGDFVVIDCGYFGYITKNGLWISEGSFLTDIKQIAEENNIDISDILNQYDNS